MFLGYYDPAKTRTPVEKLAEACRLYEAKFGKPPESCLCNPTEADELARGAGAGLSVKGVAYIPRFIFYVGVEEEP